MTTRRETAVASLCFLLLALALIGPALSGRVWIAPENVLAGDPLYRTTPDAPPWVLGDHTLLTADLPRDLTIARALRAGRLAKWNPLSAAGAPLWAEQGGPFFPLKAVLLADPSRRGYLIFLGLRLVLAAGGAYALARYRGLSPAAALAAGASFELSGPLVQQLPFGSASATCMLPWVLLGVEAIARTRSARATVGTAVALGLAGMGGHPTVAAVVYAGFAAALAGCIVSRLGEPRVALAIVALGSVALLIGLALAAPAILPFVELFAHGNSYKTRAQGGQIWTIIRDRSRATAGLALLAPHLGHAIFGNVGPFYARAATLGIAGLVLAVTGVLRRGLGAASLSVALLGVGLALAPPALAELIEFPAARFILPTYAWVLVFLPLTQAVGQATDDLATAGGLRAAGLALVLVALGIAALLVVGPPEAPIYEVGATAAAAFARAVAVEGALARLFLPLVVTTLALVVCSFTALHAARWRGRVVAALAVAELVVLWRPALQYPRSAVDAAAPPPAVQFLERHLASQDGRMIGVPFTVGTPLTPMLFALPDFRGLSALPVDRFLQYLSEIDPHSSAWMGQTVEVTRSRLLDVAAVRYLALSRADPDLPLVFDTPLVRIYENRAALPRARIVHHDVRVADAAAARHQLRVLGGGAVHARDSALRTTVVLEPDADGGWPPPLVADFGDGESEWVRITDASDSDRLVLDAELARPGLVVVADTYYPGWTATVDDEPTAIHPANAMFRAVHVPAGRHTIDMRYAPRSLRWGVVLFAVGALACVALILGSSRTARTGGTARC